MPSRRAQFLALGALVAAGVVALSVRSRTPAHAEPRPELRPASPLRKPVFAFPEDFGVRRVAIDPGHGAQDNEGNTSSFCVKEQDYTLGVAEVVRERLEATGHFEVLLTREGPLVVDYHDRADDAAAFGAEAFVSLHSDARGTPGRWSPEPGLDCPFSPRESGFSVLRSDEGDATLVTGRSELARAVAGRMLEAGFKPYGGTAYQGLYAADESADGVFVDRHAPEQRIFVLRGTAMPSVLVETHNALDPSEALRWDEAPTLDAFAASLTAALVDVLGSSDDASADTL